MNIILLKDVENLGTRHETVKVKDGFARNYLIPNKLGVIANSGNMKHVAQLIEKERAEQDAMLDDYRAIVSALEGERIVIGAKAGTTEKIFGSVTNVQLANVIKEKYGFDIDRKKIELEEEIKTLGEHVAKVSLHPEVKFDLNFEVIKE